MSRGALLFCAGLLVCGLSMPALADGVFKGGVDGSIGAAVGGLSAATIVDEMTVPPYDYPPPYSAAHHPRYHHYAHRYRHYAASPYHRHSGLEPYSYYNPEK